ncbi:hypothetical protein C8R44DRAFT_885316 [Mycena epipterygia]|nr:hypothetical protein C8R44DRAFT_885316 [Mycena epipterygia]
MRADFVAFPDDRNARISSRVYLKQFQEGIPQFSLNIAGMLFGQRNNNIYLLKTNFIADLHDEAEKEEHPLNKIGAFYKFLSH